LGFRKQGLVGVAALLALAIGCGMAEQPEANRVAMEEFKKRIAQGTLCPTGPGEVWAYPDLNDALPAPAGDLERGDLGPVYLLKIPFWCESPRAPGRQIKAVAAVEASAQSQKVNWFQVQEVGPLSFGEQVWRWFLGFSATQFVLFFMLLSWVGVEWAPLISGSVALPVGGYLCYRSFNSGLAVVACLVLQLFAGLLLYLVAIRSARRR
jgi:hypothetical protein